MAVMNGFHRSQVFRDSGKSLCLRRLCCFYSFFALSLLVSVISCRHQTVSPPDNSATQQATARTSSVVALSSDEQSCKVFVQKFYDWYWNRFAERAERGELNLREKPTYHEVARRSPAVLTPELIKLIKRDEAASEAAQGIANLDFDPFLNSQDAEGKYDVAQATVNGGVCRAKLSQRDIDAEVKRDGPGWVFSNFYYSFYSEDRLKKEAPDDNLAHILSKP